jgi:hypothetical protein
MVEACTIHKKYDKVSNKTYSDILKIKDNLGNLHVNIRMISEWLLYV